MSEPKPASEQITAVGPSEDERADGGSSATHEEPRSMPPGAGGFLPVMGHMPAGPPLEGDEFTSIGPGGPTPVDTDALNVAIVAALKTVYDPEIPVNIYDLGLIYSLDVSKEGEVEIEMTLTAPGCPVAGPLVREVADKAASVAGVHRARVQLVWDPPWTMDRMTEEAKLELGLL